MLIKPCAKCSIMIPYGRSHCPTCEEIVKAEREMYQAKRKKARDRVYNRKRDPKYMRFYASGDWRRTSKAKMVEANYKCETCGSIAAEVHHIKPIQTPEGWEQRLEWSNLAALCIKCHNRAHKRWGKNRPTTRN